MMAKKPSSAPRPQNKTRRGSGLGSGHLGPRRVCVSYVLDLELKGCTLGGLPALCTLTKITQKNTRVTGTLRVASAMSRGWQSPPVDFTGVRGPQIKEPASVG